MGAGHASTSIGYAVGIKEGMRHLDAAVDGKVVAVIGDGAMTGGVAFEAIGQAGGLGTPIVVVLNDNGMSIAPNVGALSRYFNRVRLNPKLWRARAGVEGGLDAPADRDRRRVRAPGPAPEGVDQGVLGARPVVGGARLGLHGRGRRPRRARAARGAARGARGRAAGGGAHRDRQGQGLRAGRGGRPGGDGEVARRQAQVDPQRLSAPGPRQEIRLGRRCRSAPPPQYTQVFGEALVRECERDERVVGITAAMNSGTGLSILQKAMPDRYFDVGIAEQQAILFAAGLALEGVKPVAAIYSTFLQRAYDQIVHDVCLQKLNVVFAMDRAGLVGDDGPTHHGAFDIAYLRCLPNIVLMAPRDEAMLVHMLRTALEHDGGRSRCAIRAARGWAWTLPSEGKAIAIGTGEILCEAEVTTASASSGRRVALIGYGSGVGKALDAAERLRGQEIAVTVVDARFAKPIDAGLMAQLAAEHDLLVTVEEGVLAGGFGSAVWETLNEAGATPRILRVGLPDRYVTHGKPALLHEEVGFTGERIAERVAAAISDRGHGRTEQGAGPLGTGAIVGA